MNKKVEDMFEMKEERKLEGKLGICYKKKKKNKAAWKVVKRFKC